MEWAEKVCTEWRGPSGDQAAFGGSGQRAGSRGGDGRRESSPGDKPGHGTKRGKACGGRGTGGGVGRALTLADRATTGRAAAMAAILRVCKEGGEGRREERGLFGKSAQSRLRCRLIGAGWVA